MPKEFFPPRPVARPTIYAYVDTHPQYAGLLKIGYTAGDVRKRVAQQYPTLRPGPEPYRIVLEEAAMRPDGTAFTDRDVHRQLRQGGVANPEGEWFRCDVGRARAAILALRGDGAGPALREPGAAYEDRSLSFGLRPEQAAAVEKTAAYFEKIAREEPGKTPHFLWNAKMRFGKTFTAYQLALRLGWRRVLVLTFKPAVQSAWEADLRHHVDFAGWQFLSRDGLSYDEADKTRPFVYFGSFQDHLGKNKVGGIKLKNEWVHTINWDGVIFDEYHYGAWRENARELFEAEGEKEEDFALGQGIELLDDDGETIIPITTRAYLYLSGTPFRAIAIPI